MLRNINLDLPSRSLEKIKNNPQKVPNSKAKNKKSPEKQNQVNKQYHLSSKRGLQTAFGRPLLWPPSKDSSHKSVHLNARESRISEKILAFRKVRAVHWANWLWNASKVFGVTKLHPKKNQWISSNARLHPKHLQTTRVFKQKRFLLGPRGQSFCCSWLLRGFWGYLGCRFFAKV